MCVCVFGIYPCTDGLQPVFTHLVCTWLDGSEQCAPVRMQRGCKGWDESLLETCVGGVLQAPKPPGSSEKLLKPGASGHRARKAQVHCNPASPVLGNFRRPGSLSALHPSKDFPLQPLRPPIHKPRQHFRSSFVDIDLQLVGDRGEEVGVGELLGTWAEERLRQMGAFRQGG